MRDRNSEARPEPLDVFVTVAEARELVPGLHSQNVVRWCLAKQLRPSRATRTGRLYSLRWLCELQTMWEGKRRA